MYTGLWFIPKLIGSSVLPLINNCAGKVFFPLRAEGRVIVVLAAVGIGGQGKMVAAV